MSARSWLRNPGEVYNNNTLSNWITASSLLLAIISISLHIIQRCRRGTRGDTTETRTAVGVTINNIQDPVSQSDRVVTNSPMIALPHYGVAEVTEAIEMALVVRQKDQYGLPIPFSK